MRIRIANAPCSWGVLEFEGVASPLEPQTVLSEIAASGYAGTELGDYGFLPTDAAELIAVLRQHDLALVGGFVPVALADPEAHAPGEAAALATAGLMAAVDENAVVVLSDDNATDAVRARVAGRVRAEDALDDDAMATFAAGADRIAAAVADQTGLGTVFHHHGGGWIETPSEVARLMDRCNPDRLGLCLDVGHYMFGGGDPLEAMSRFGDRIRHVHFKDFDPAVLETSEGGYLDAVRRGVFCELGRGAAPFSELVAALKARDYAGWIVVEQDVLPSMGAPLASATRNRQFLRRLGLS